MSADFDVIVIGGGHNGLVSAAWLAKAGRKVLLLERRSALGGSASTEELFPGFHFNTGAADAGLLQSSVIKELDLHSQGLEFIDSRVAAFAPQPDGRALTLWRDPEKSSYEIAAHSANDARAFLLFQQQNERFAKLLTRYAGLRPPTIRKNSPGVLLAWAQLALRLRGLGRRQLMGAPNGSFRSSLVVRGGLGQLSAALARAAQASGAVLKTSAPVQSILSEKGRVLGVRLQTGEELRS